VWFADVDRATGNIATWECGLPKYVFAPVHYAGRAAHIPERQHTDMVVVEDACHALGATDFDGCSRVGSCAHSLATVFSTHAVKPITTGEGGAVTTNDQGFADEVRMLRSHGRRDGEMVALGMNARMTDIQAALGRSQLQRCDEMRERRMVLAESYYDALDRMDEEGAIALPDPLHHWEWNAWHLYPIRIKNGKRDAVKSALNAQGIGAQVHYPSIHLQRYYRERFGYKPGDFPEAEAWAAEELSLPLHAGMTERDVTRVVDALRKELSA
jgi:dTDP-4-amino-4,6-dideoxygalactose transaminase